MGTNAGNSAANATSTPTNSVEPTTFRVKVVEYLSRESYDEETGRFRPGHESNKAISGRKVKIKMPDGSIIEKTTDENGVIELTDQNPTAEFEIIFEPEDAAFNNNESLFYNRTAVVKTEI